MPEFVLIAWQEIHIVIKVTGNVLHRDSFKHWHHFQRGQGKLFHLSRTYSA